METFVSKYMLIIIALLIFIVELFFLKLSLSCRNGGFLNKFFIFYYIFQAALAVFILTLDIDYTIYLIGYSIKLKETFFPYVVASFFAVFGILCAMEILDYFSQSRRNNSLVYRIQLLCSQIRINLFCILLSFVFIFNFVTVFFPVYFVSVFFVTFSFCPILVGVFWYKLNNFVKIYWIILLLVGLLLHSVQGSRGYALMPIVLFILGYYFSVKLYHPELLHRRRIAVVFITLLAVLFLSKAQDFREKCGRGLDVSYETISKFIDFMNESSEEKNTSGIKGSFGRLLHNPNFTIPLMCPSMIPFRGADSMSDEIKSIFVFNGAEGSIQSRLRRSSLNYGVGALSRYGYYITENTSTGLSLFADGYSRFGYLGLLFYSFIYALILGMLENMSFYLSRKNIVVSELFYFFVLNAGILSFDMTYYTFLKIFIFRCTLVLIIGLGLYKICEKKL